MIEPKQLALFCEEELEELYYEPKLDVPTPSEEVDAVSKASVSVLDPKRVIQDFSV